MRPPKTAATMRVLKPLSRIAIAAVPALQRYASRVRPTPFKVPLSAVERVVQVGKARAISVAGDLKAGMTALDESLPYRFVQIANTPLEPNIDKLKERSRAQNVCDAWDILWPRSNRRDVKYVKGNTGRSWRPAAAVRLKLPAHF